MIFMINARSKAGLREQKSSLTLQKGLDPATWNLIRNGLLSFICYKVGDEPGFFAVLSAPSIEEAQALVDSSAQEVLEDQPGQTISAYPGQSRTDAQQLTVSLFRSSHRKLVW